MKIAIFGASGQGREVADICREIGYEEIIFLVSDEKEESPFSEKIFLDTKETVLRLKDEGYDFSIGISSSIIRQKIYNNYPNLEYPNIVHPSSTFGYLQRKKFNQSKGNIVSAGVRFTNNIFIGNFGIYNLNATVSHDSIIEDYVSIMSAVNISGNVHIHKGAYIGVNAAILQGNIEKKLIIGENSIVGAGAVVTKDVSENVTVAGVPAKILVNKKLI